MKIEREQIKKVTKILKDIKYIPLKGSRSDIVFLIDTAKTKEIDGLQLDFVDNKFGSEKMPDPVLMMNNDEEHPVALAYCDTTFARKFDFVSFCELSGIKLSKNDEELLEQLDCFLVAKENILIAF